MKGISDAIRLFIVSLLSSEGASSKRFWGGILIANSIFMSWFRPKEDDLIMGMLLYGASLLGLGFMDKLGKGKDKKDEIT